MKRLLIIDIKDSATDLTLSLLQLRTRKNSMPRKRKLQLETNGLICFITLYGLIQRMESLLKIPETK